MVRSFLVVGLIAVAGIVVFYYHQIGQRRAELFQIVEADFHAMHPKWEFIDCGLGEGDLIVSYVQVRFRKVPGAEIVTEEWQYWDTDSGWLNREKYLKSIKPDNSLLKVKQ